MMFNTIEKKINDNTYNIIPFTGTEGLDIMFEFIGYTSTILKLFSKDLSASLSLRSLLDSTLEENAVDKVVDALQDLLLVEESRKKIITFIRRLVSGVSRNGKDDLSRKEVFDLIFSKNYEELILLAKEVIVENFLSQSFMQRMLSKKLQQP